MLTIYLVRHGETLFNVREVVQGWVDSPLTERGWEQVRTVATRLALRPIAGVYTSTSERARDTAEAIAAVHPGISVVADRGFKELHFGDFEARPNDAVLAAMQPVDQFFSGMIGGSHPGLPGGESGAAFRTRVQAAMARVVADHPAGGEVVVVSHGVTINTLLVLAGWHSPGPLKNASISILRHSGNALPECIAVGLDDVDALF